MSYVSRQLLQEVTIPEQGILSRTLHNDEFVKVVIFAFSAGHELSAHTAPMPAILQILQGKALVTLGEETHSLEAGALVTMPPRLTHAVVAETPMVMLLSLLKQH